MHYDEDVIVGLDIGTTKVCAVIGQINEYGFIDIIGVGVAPSRGLRKGVVVNIESTVQSVATAVEKAELMAGIEVDILKDGRLDFPDAVLAELDFVTASPHSALRQGGSAATARLIRAIENPHVHVIGHPSGRLIGRRAGMDIDIARIAAAAAANDTALEINAHPWRLDLRDVHVRAAIDAGAKLLICTDAHGPEPDGDLSLMRFRVATARRGWVTAADVINTYTPARLIKWLRR